MPVRFSAVLPAQVRGSEESFLVRSIDLHALGDLASPIALLDDFRVRGRPFGPHPHAGFSAVTYVFGDSQGNLRSRDSLGNDAVTGPGGIIWTQAASGVIHEEIPAEPGRELHGLQVFVNLRSNNKLAAPRVFRLAGDEVPVWQGKAGDAVRVAAGSFENVSSPLVPAEPFTLLDVSLRSQVSLRVEQSHNTLVYTRTGGVVIRANGGSRELRGEQAIAFHGSGSVALTAMEHSQIVVLSGAEIREPVIVSGPFIMNDTSQIEAAVARYRSGGMGHLTVLPDR